MNANNVQVSGGVEKVLVVKEWRSHRQRLVPVRLLLLKLVAMQLDHVTKRLDLDPVLLTKVDHEDIELSLQKSKCDKFDHGSF